MNGNTTVLILAPRGRDAELTRSMLAQHDIAAEVCDSPATLPARMANAGCAIVTHEALTLEFRQSMGTALGAQPPWSDFPLIVLLNARSTLSLTEALGNLTLLERPVAPMTLLAAVRAALRARRRQYEARTAIEQRDQFLAMLGHELRNPLAAIVLASRLAQENSDRGQLEHRLAVIERQSKMLARLVDDLLDVARVTSGKVQLRREAVDVDAAIRNCIEIHEERARAHAIDLVFSSGCGAIIEADTVRIEQVLSNLVSNAIKYSPAGRSVRISATRVGDSCEIRVRDQGIGIAPEMQPRVFDLFAQVAGTMDRAEGGMGIGLTLVDRLVRLHGGTIELRSEGLGKGSEFIIRLPVGSPAIPQDVIRLPVATSGKVRVVLVEDNADLRELSADLLETLGCSVEVAVDGLEGVERIVASRPDLALIDIGLPKLDGFELAREVRRQLGPDQFLVAATGYGREQDREEAQRAGFDLHVTKPLVGDVLTMLIERARSRRDVRKTG